MCPYAYTRDALAVQWSHGWMNLETCLEGRGNGVRTWGGWECFERARGFRGWEKAWAQEPGSGTRKGNSGGPVEGFPGEEPTGMAGEVGAGLRSGLQSYIPVGSHPRPFGVSSSMRPLL